LPRCYCLRPRCIPSCMKGEGIQSRHSQPFQWIWTGCWIIFLLGAGLLLGVLFARQTPQKL
jgi:hypothetical protein